LFYHIWEVSGHLKRINDRFRDTHGPRHSKRLASPH
jgi:hypothetical protein